MWGLKKGCECLQSYQYGSSWSEIGVKEPMIDMFRIHGRPNEDTSAYNDVDNNSNNIIIMMNVTQSSQIVAMHLIYTDYVSTQFHIRP